ncbi:MAG: taurine dioxygenase [Gammaproteobacteria bacterium]|nr:taurine dioxygenase [Gammaproteobacteria bacterium]
MRESTAFGSRRSKETRAAVDKALPLAHDETIGYCARTMMSANPAEIAGTELQATLMTGYTGVRIDGLRLKDARDDQVEEIRRLVGEFCVAVFPGQFIGPQEHVALISRFGKVTHTPGVDMHPEHEEVHVVANRGGSAPVSGGFHTDTCFVARPPSFTSLSAIEVPEHGGDTVFANQYLAYESLSDVMKGWLCGLRLKHVVSGTERPEAVPRPVWHPAVRTHPVTGRKALYVTYADRCIEAEGMTAAEGANLISFLYQHSLAQHAMYRHSWAVGDFVLWDNRCSLHAAVYDHGDQPRTLYRVMCEGEVPSE